MPSGAFHERSSPPRPHLPATVASECLTTDTGAIERLQRDEMGNSAATLVREPRRDAKSAFVA